MTTRAIESPHDDLPRDSPLTRPGHRSPSETTEARGSICSSSTAGRDPTLVRGIASRDA